MSLTRSDAVVALGKKLVEQLGASDDMLASWMAHHIADLIARAESASPDDRAAAEEACANTILKLWSHRNALPAHLRPLGDLQPVLRTLAFLDLNPEDVRYYRAPMREAVLAGVEGEARRAIEIAMNLDYTARVLIRLMLQEAVTAAADSATTWVELAKAAGVEDAGEQKLIDLIRTKEGTDIPGYDSARAALEDRASRLEAFAGAAAAQAADLRKRLSEPDTDKV